MKRVVKNIFVILIVVLEIGIFTSCGNIINVSEDNNIEELIKEIEPETNIEAIVKFNEETGCYDEHNGMGYVAMTANINAINDDESFLARVDEFNNRNKCDVRDGYFVILEGEEQPDYFIEKDTQQVFRTKTVRLSEDKDYYFCYIFASDKDFLTYCVLLNEDMAYQQEYIKDCENKKYLIQGKILDNMSESSCVLIDGTANRYDGKDYYKGEIRLDFNNDDNINIVNDMISVEGFSLKEDNFEDDYWFNYKCFGTVGCTLIGKKYEYVIKMYEDKRNLLEKLTNIDEKSISQSNTEQLELEWYQKNSLYFNEVRNCKLEIVWYDNGQIDLAFDGMTVYSFDMKEVSQDSVYPGCYIYSSDNAVLIYKPGNDYITIMDDGTYEGDYSVLGS